MCTTPRGIQRTRTAGLIHPTRLLWAAMRASLTAAIIEAKIGADADVPPETKNSPSSATTMGNLYARGSVIVRRDELKHAGVLTHSPRRLDTRVQTG